MSEIPMERKRPTASGYRMITDLTVSNFRCFDQLELTDLKRVTVITGASGSGKTALLEALLIAAKGNPEAAMRANKGRALPENFMNVIPNLFQGLAVTSAQGFQSSWSGLFNNPAKPFFMSYRDTEKGLYSLAVTFSNDGSSLNVPLLSVENAQVKSVVFERIKNTVAEPSITISLNQNGQMQASRNSEDFGPSLFYFTSTAQFAEIDNVSWFSNLRMSGKAEKVIKIISADFPFIKDLQVLSPANATGIYAIMADNTVRPLSLVSSGIHKIFSLYCGVSDLNDGVILLDEIENGVYYERYTSLWRHLYEMAVETRNQLFVTSHSSECLHALLPVLAEKVEDFTLLRTERQNGQCVVQQISGQAMRAALRGEIDLRGSVDAA